MVHRKDRGKREAGGGVIATFYDGYALVKDLDWDFISKLDGDLSFGPEYFERCFSRFYEDSKLGMGGGVCCLEDATGVRIECASDPDFHVRGPTKLYRRECWNDIGGLIKAPGWDTIDQIKANMLGWRTKTFKDIQIIHHRPTGAAYGGFKDAMKNGTANYITGYHPLFMFFKCAKRLFQKPYVIEAVALAAGFLRGYLKNLDQVNDPEMIRYLRKQQLRALTFRKSLWT